MTECCIDMKGEIAFTLLCFKWCQFLDFTKRAQLALLFWQNDTGLEVFSHWFYLFFVLFRSCWTREWYLHALYEIPQVLWHRPHKLQVGCVWHSTPSKHNNMLCPFDCRQSCYDFLLLLLLLFGLKTEAGTQAKLMFNKLSWSILPLSSFCEVADQTVIKLLNTNPRKSLMRRSLTTKCTKAMG